MNKILNQRSLVLLSILIAMPIAMIIVLALLSFDVSGVSFSLSGFSELLTPLRLGEIGRITQRALLVSIVATALSYFISYLLILHTSKGFQSLFYILITLPFLANESVRVFSWQYVLAENGVFNQFLSAISGSSVHFFDGSNAANVYLTMVVTCIPFGIFINSAALLTIPAIYWRVADDLKLNHLTKLIKIALPLSTFAIISALITIFFVAFSLSAEVNFLGGDSKISMRNFVLSLMSASRFQAVFSLGCFVLLLLGVFMLFYTYFNRSKQ